MTQPTILEQFSAHITNYHLQVQCAMHGPRLAKIAIIGDYPGAADIGAGRPFSGGSGKYLWDALRPYNVLQTEVYKTHVIKRAVSPNNKPQQHELTLWKEALEYELSLLPDLEYILCLGNYPLEALLGYSGITQFRGSVYEWKDKQVTIANSPAMILRDPKQEIIFRMDIKKFAEVFNGDFRPHIVNKHVLYDYNDAVDYLNRLKLMADKAKALPVSFDIETLNANQCTACFGLATDAHNGYCIPLRAERDLCFTTQQEYSLYILLLEVLNHPNVQVIAQNGSFDSYFMGVKDAAPFNVHHDTLLAHHTLYPTLPHNLGFLTSQYTSYPYYKDEKDRYKEGADIDAFWQYNATDAAITFAVYEGTKRELEQQGLDLFFYGHVMRVHPHLVNATVCGIKIDTEMKQELYKTVKTEVDAAYEEFQTATRAALMDDTVEVNPNSPKQLAKLIFDDLKAVHRRRSVDSAVRNDLMEDNRTSMATKSILTALDRYAEQHKFFSTYVETAIDPDNRFRAEFKQFGVQRAPGRLSSSKVAWGTGGNLQNQPRSAYPMFVADDDTVYIYFDLAQAEARVVGWRAGIDKWIEDFERARLNPGTFDAHRSLAAAMYNMEYDLTPEYDFDPETGEMTIRFVAKRCRHGLNYRMQPPRLAATTGMLYTSAIRNYNIYHSINPELKRWWALEEQTVRKTRQQFNAYGRRNQLFGRLDEGALDSIIAFYPQSTIGDKTQRVWYQCHEDSKWDRNKARIAINVHDALYGFARADYAMTALSIMKRYAEEPIMIENIFTKQISPMIVPADLKMSKPDEHGIHRMSGLKAVTL